VPLSTAAARLSAFNDGTPWEFGPPFPDGAVDQADRQTVAYGYAGILAAEAAALADLRPALRAFLLADPTVAAAVGARIYPNRLPQGVRATAIVYRRPNRRGDHHMQGPSGLARGLWQLACWSESLDGAAALARAVKDRLEGWQGPMTDPDGNIVQVQGAFLETARDAYDDDTELRGVLAEYAIWHETR
jgi:hypothetical protein